VHYLGGKHRFGTRISSIINTYLWGKDYYEPFFGMGGVLQHITAINRFASDLDPDLISMWKALKKGWVPPTYVSRGAYYRIRNNPGLVSPKFRGAIGFGSSFGGKKWGSYADEGKRGYCNYADVFSRSSQKRIAKMVGVKFECKSYQDVTPIGAVIYCDPPYINTTGYKWLPSFDTTLFWQWCRERREDGNTLFISEYTAPDDIEQIAQWNSAATLNSNGTRPLRVEKLFLMQP
jgi:DNA adenine methylase